MNLKVILPLLLLCSGNVPGQTMTTPKSECEQLMNSALPLAEKMLKEHGEFFPYGQVLGTDGKTAEVGAYDGRERPPSADLIRMLKKTFVAGAKSGKYRATALVYDV